MPNVPITAVATGDNLIVAGIPGCRIRVWTYQLHGDGTIKARWRSRSASGSYRDLSGPMRVWQLSRLAKRGQCFETEVGDDLVLSLNGASLVSGFASYSIVGSPAIAAASSSAVVPLDPRNAPGLLAWFEEDAGFFQDTAAATPATTYFDTVRRWSDQSGNGWHLTQATAARKCVLDNTVYGYRGLRSRSDTQGYLSFAAGLQPVLNNLSVYMRFCPQDALLNGGLLTLDGFLRSFDIFYDDTQQLSVRTDQGYTRLVGTLPSDCILSVISSPGSIKINLNGTIQYGAPSPPVTSAGGGNVGAMFSGDFAANAIISKLIICNQAHSDAVEAQMRAHLATPGFISRYSQNYPFISHFGNSYVRQSGANPQPYNGYAMKAQATLVNPYQYAVLGYLGMKIKQYASAGANPQLTERYPAEVRPGIHAAKVGGGKVIFSPNEILNSSGDGTGAQLYADWKALCQLAANDGATVVLWDSPYASTGGASLTNLQGCNALLAADFPVATANPYVWLPSVSVPYGVCLIRQSLMPFTSGDGTHPDNALHAIMGTAYAFAIGLASVAGIT